VSGARRWLWAGFLVLCLAQLAVPAARIWTWETTLRDGEPFRFRCEPIDPEDALRGRYVDLNFADAEVDTDGADLKDGGSWTVRVVAGEDGFARLSAPSATPPPDGAWIRVRAWWGGESGGTTRVRLPFDRFYMDERDAPRAEAALRRPEGEAVEAWLTVRILDGRAVPEMLYLDGVPVGEYLARD
jgi:hypothetical protein